VLRSVGRVSAVVLVPASSAIDVTSLDLGGIGVGCCVLCPDRAGCF
jgi:hypothetical protein